MWPLPKPKAYQHQMGSKECSCSMWWMQCLGSYRGQGVSGEPKAMALYLDRSFGEGTAEMMETIAKRHPWKPTLLELETLRDEMKRTLELNGYVSK